MNDGKNVQETFLFKLSNYKGLDWFKNIVFVSSFEDNFVPYQSSRVQEINPKNNTEE